MPSFHLTSRLLAPAGRVWAHATDMEGVNFELAPLLRMTYPKGPRSLEGREVPLGAPLFRSVILLFGVLPIDYDDVTFESLETGRRFVERSPTMSQRVWRHERTVESVGEGCSVRDRITFEPRLPGMGAVLAPALQLLFRNRHRKLVQRFGGEAGVIQRG